MPQIFKKRNKEKKREETKKQRNKKTKMDKGTKKEKSYKDIKKGAPEQRRKISNNNKDRKWTNWKVSVKIEGKDNTGDDLLRNYILLLPTILDAFPNFSSLVLYCSNSKNNTPFCNYDKLKHWYFE